MFGGNPLAVFPEAEALDDETMQQVAREMNLSESVFLLPPRTPEGTRRVRIFTPAAEVPFAGHPTVGTAVYLALAGAVDPEGEAPEVVLEEGVGPVRVRLSTDGGGGLSARLTAAAAPERRPAPWPPADLAALVSLEPGDVGGDGLEPEVVSAGLPFLVVPVSGLDAIRRAALDAGLYARLGGVPGADKVYLVSREAEGEGVDVRVRMFAPALGVPEDPATGSAAAALAVYLGSRTAGEDGTRRWRIEQGIEAGRPSLLVASADVRDGEVAAVHVEGRAVPVSRGVMEVPVP